MTRSCIGFPVTELLFGLSERLSEADNQRLRRNAGGAFWKIGDERDRILKIGFSAGNPRNNLIV